MIDKTLIAAAINYSLIGLLVSLPVLWIMSVWYSDNDPKQNVVARSDYDMKSAIDHGASEQMAQIGRSGQTTFWRRYQLHYLLWLARGNFGASLLTLFSCLLWIAAQN